MLQYYQLCIHFVHDVMLFDYTYFLILRTGQSPISSDNRLSTVQVLMVNSTLRSSSAILYSKILTFYQLHFSFSHIRYTYINHGPL